MSNSKTILGFDSWTGGAKKYARLLPALEAQGYTLILVHLGSWGADVGRPLSEYIDQLEVRDINYYGSLNFEQILLKESPSAVLFLSNDVFAHRAFNRYAIKQGIPTLRLYHGIVSVQDISTSQMHTPSLINQIKFVLIRLPKAMIKVWPCYIKALLRTRASFKDWRKFFRDVVFQALGKYIEHSADDCRTTACAVYTPADVEHAHNKYNYQHDEIYVVGNPDFISFNISPDTVGRYNADLADTYSDIVYIDTGLFHAGMVFDNQKDFFKHLLHTQEQLAAQGLKLSIKLHPQHFKTSLPADLNNHGIEVLDNNNFVPKLLQSKAAIVEPSTVALVPSVLGMPILAANYGKLASQKYGSVITSYPRYQRLDSLSTMSDLLPLVNKCELNESVSDWIKINAGPFPVENMPSRVVDILAKITANAK